MNKENEQVVSGRYYSLKVKRIKAHTYLLEAGGQAISLPASEAPDHLSPGDFIDVFVYMSGRDGLKATTRTPYACLGEIAAMKVLSVTDFGVFVDWGIVKDLFVPAKLLRADLEIGDMAIVHLVPDHDGIGVLGTCKFEDVFETDTIDLEENQEVSCLIFGIHDAGFRVILDNKYKGLLYHNEIFEHLAIGDNRKAYIKKIRDDGLIDAVLQKQTFREASGDAREIILDAIDSAGGFLPLHDKSSPEEIASALKISKKIFKKTIGGLYRDRVITLEGNGIRLK